MTETSVGEAQAQIDELVVGLLDQYSHVVPYNPWINEDNRWHELAVCVLFSLGDQAGQDARHAVRVLTDMDLLKVSDLASVPWSGDQPEFAHAHLALMRSVLARLGFADENISLALREIVRLAQDLVTHYDGHIQVYLRRHGERMLADLGTDFPSISATDESVRRAFATWLQNVLTMPIFLDTSSAAFFCESAGCTVEDLHQAADRAGVSASVLDDLLDAWSAELQKLAAAGQRNGAQDG
jgi:hypothetical protein